MIREVIHVYTNRLSICDVFFFLLLTREKRLPNTFSLKLLSAVQYCKENIAIFNLQEYPFKATRTQINLKKKIDLGPLILIIKENLFRISCENEIRMKSQVLFYMKSEACLCQLAMHTDRSSYYKINKYLCNTLEKLTRAGRTICPLVKGLSETAISWA